MLRPSTHMSRLDNPLALCHVERAEMASNYLVADAEAFQDLLAEEKALLQEAIASSSINSGDVVVRACFIGHIAHMALKRCA
jgi:hypothetical protein